MHNRFRFFSGLLLGALVAVVVAALLMRPSPPDRRKGALALAQRQLAIQATLIDSLRSVQQAGLLANVLALVDADLQARPDRTLRDETVGRIVNFTQTVQPYAVVRNDTLSGAHYSPERGQLLRVLFRQQLDTLTWQAILSRATFAHADLHGADLREADLRGIDLEGADLQDADLRQADLRDARLQTIRAYGANLHQANLAMANLQAADLRWADLDSANLFRTDLLNASLGSTRLNHTMLDSARLAWADAGSATITRSSLRHADLTGTNLRQVQLTASNLDSALLVQARLFDVRWDGSSLRDVVLNLAQVPNGHWFAMLDSLGVRGAAELVPRYRLVDKRPKGMEAFQVQRLQQ